MLLSKIENNTVVTTYSVQEFRAMFPDTVFPEPLTNEHTRNLGFRVVDTSEPPIEMKNSMDKNTIIIPTMVYSPESDEVTREYSLQPYQFDIEKRVKDKRDYNERKYKIFRRKVRKYNLNTNMLFADVYEKYLGEVALELQKEDPFLAKFDTPPWFSKNTLEEHKVHKHAEVKNTFKTYTTKPRVYIEELNFHVDGGRESKDDFKTKHEMMLVDEVTIVKDADNVFHYDITKDQMGLIWRDIAKHGEELYAWKWEKEAAIQACTTIEELEAL